MSNITEVIEWRLKVVNALLAKTHRQQKWLNGHDVKTMIESRGFHVYTDVLEKWDRMGILHPVLRFNYPISLHRKIADGRYPGWEGPPIEGATSEDKDLVQVVNNGWSPEFVTQPEFQARRDELVLVPTTDNFQDSNSYKVDTPWAPLNSGGVYYHPYQIFRINRVVDSCWLKCSFTSFSVKDGLEEIFQQDLVRALTECVRNMARMGE